jgi:DNA-binding NarL/FixJ family response regulator
MKRRIHIVDDHPIVLSGYSMVINAQADLVVTGTSTSVAEAISVIPQDPPDLVITDLTMTGRGGIDLVKDLTAVCPGIKILVISMHDELLYAERALRAGARGYVMKESDATWMLKAVRQVLDGGICVSERVASRILDRVAGAPPRGAASPLEQLTDRELEVFRLLGEGRTTKEAASLLNLSPKTIAVHRDNIKAKLGITSSVELLRHAVRWVETQSVQGRDGQAGGDGEHQARE